MAEEFQVKEGGLEEMLRNAEMKKDKENQFYKVGMNPNNLD